jgi:hypothetical protein
MEQAIKEKILDLAFKHDHVQMHEVDSKYAKPLISLHMIQCDIVGVIEAIKKAIALCKPEAIENDEIVISALWQKAIITYGKVFTKSADGFSSLEASKYIKTEADMEIHKKLMNIRNGFIAHRGANDFENILLVARLRREKNEVISEYGFPSAYRLGNYLKDDEIPETLAYLQRLKNDIVEKLESKIVKLDKKIWVEQ